MEQNDSELLKVVTKRLDTLTEAIQKLNDIMAQLPVGVTAIQKQVQQLADHLKVKLPG